MMAPLLTQSARWGARKGEGVGGPGRGTGGGRNILDMSAVRRGSKARPPRRRAAAPGPYLQLMRQLGRDKSHLVCTLCRAGPAPRHRGCCWPGGGWSPPPTPSPSGNEFYTDFLSISPFLLLRQQQASSGFWSSFVTPSPPPSSRPWPAAGCYCRPRTDSLLPTPRSQALLRSASLHWTGRVLLIQGGFGLRAYWRTQRTRGCWLSG